MDIETMDTPMVDEYLDKTQRMPRYEVNKIQRMREKRRQERIAAMLEIEKLIPYLCSKCDADRNRNCNCPASVAIDKLTTAFDRRGYSEGKHLGLADELMKNLTEENLTAELYIRLKSLRVNDRQIFKKIKRSSMWLVNWKKRNGIIGKGEIVDERRKA